MDPIRRMPVIFSFRVACAPRYLRCQRSRPRKAPVPSKVKTVAYLEIDYPRVVPMRTAEGVTRVLEIAVVGKICSIQGEQPALPYAFAKREIKGGMRRQVPGAIPIEESRSVLVGRSSPEVVRQAQRQDPANGIPLIVVEEKVSNRRILDQTTGNGSDTLADRIRIGGTKLSHLEESWGSQRDFGALDD